MECNKWEEMGLLYSSGELNDLEQKSYSEHLEKCLECRGQMAEYRKMQPFFSFDILGEIPSAACDTEILRVCSDARKKVLGINSISLFFKKSVISVSLFIVGFITVGSIVMVVEQKNSGITTVRTTIDSAETQSAATTFEKGVTDSLSKDTSENREVNFAKTRGNLDLKGVYPVDLQSK